ncbi:MAG TPA: hypothetical protein VLT86_13905 [Vicinamibacterales bacterium]|nr:hypothetical protein [Vicinamibacterales bacterium]
MTRDAGARRLDPAGGPALALIYTVIAVVMTWPLMRHPSTRIASDLGDPLFICWVLMWTGGQVLAALRGDTGALADYWNGNIFYPARGTIAYSEHFTPQMLQILPLYAAGANIILCYNLLFLSTFVVASLGMYLFVRELTGRPLAAFLAGLAFAYAPYRLGQLPHLQVLSIGWMPLALFGLHRFFAAGRIRSLAGGAAAFVVQSLSCGYYFMFFAPLLAAYGLYEMARRRVIASPRIWIRLSAAAVIVALALWPFMRPYLALRATTPIGVRSLDDTIVYAADTHALGTIAPSARLEGTLLSGYPKAEGEAFPGFTILGFAAIALVARLRRALRRVPWRTMATWQLALWWAGAATSAFSIAGVVTIFVRGRLTLTTSGSVVVMQDASTLLWIAALSSAWLFGFTRALQRAAGETDRVSASFWLGVACVAALFAFGPDIRAAGHLVGHGPYVWAFNHVPGFDVLRVPARFFTIVTLALAVLAGLGAAVLLGPGGPLGKTIVSLGILALLSESWIVPMATNLPIVPESLAPPRAVTIGRDINPLYRMIKNLPDRVVLIEFPFGEPAYEIQAVFYAGYHRRPIVNGYSGFFAPGYFERATVLSQAPDDPDAARQTLAASGATHALVHEGAFPDGRGKAIIRWLEALGARVEATSNTDTLLVLPRLSAIGNR